MGNNSVLVIGDVTIDVFLHPKEGETSCQRQEDGQYLCFSYGDKIPVDQLHVFTGGNAANVAIGLKRLDIPASIMSTIGTDSTSKIIYEHLQAEGIDTKQVTMQPGTSSNYSTVISYQGERTILTYHAPRAYTYRKEPIIDAYVYLTSMGEQYMPFYQDVIIHLREYPAVTMIFNPGSLQTRASTEEIQLILSRTDILLCNRQEAEIFTDIRESTDKEKLLLDTLKTMGPKEIVITDGQQGTYAFDGNQYIHCSVIPVKVIEKTGAGDSFNAGFLAAKLHGKSFTDAIKWGTMNAASVIGYIGAQKGLLTTKDIDAWLRIFESSHVSLGNLEE